MCCIQYKVSKISISDIHGSDTIDEVLIGNSNVLLPTSVQSKGIQVKMCRSMSGLQGMMLNNMWWCGRWWGWRQRAHAIRGIPFSSSQWSWQVRDVMGWIFDRRLGG